MMSHSEDTNMPVKANLIGSNSKKKFLSKYNMKQYLRNYLIIVAFCCIGVILSAESSEVERNRAVESQNYAFMDKPNGYQRRMLPHLLRIRRDLGFDFKKPEYEQVCGPYKVSDALSAERTP
ncbi:Hypothetical predicted protein [Octopus vulgaris]|uniref:Uncharacterized protein n=1 Tax=Octopus vulgaris TaxID=6645 RepID=A0AA36AVZ8_OCTVU|nr:Hypothetical predicted protein [Octopus vulgaris]